METVKQMVKAKTLIVGGMTDEIFKFICSKKAVISSEIWEEFQDKIKRKEHISSYLKQLLKNDFIKRSNKKVRSLKKKEASCYIYGISEDSIEQKRYEIESQIDEKIFLVGIKKKVYEIILNSDIGLTLAEVVYSLRKFEELENYSNFDHVFCCLRDLVTKENLIVRSSFKIPDNCMIHGRKAGFVYGRDFEAIKSKIVQLMPSHVKKAFFDMIYSNEVFPIDVLKEKYGISEQEVKSWFTYRFVSMGWLKVYSYKQRRYYYNPSVPESVVIERVPKIHEDDVIKSILNESSLGSAFEHQAIFYFVMYLIRRYNLQIRLNTEFPKKIPSWFNKDDIHKYAPENKRLVDVWKFDNDPIDYLVFVYDDILQVPIQGYAVSVKRDNKGKYLGTAGKKYITSFIGCLSQGYSYDSKPIPQFNCLKPVLIMNNAQGIKLFEWAQKTGCLLLYSKKVQQIINFCNKLGIHYDKDMDIKQLSEESLLLEKYENHEDVLLGKSSPHEILKREIGVGK